MNARKEDAISQIDVLKSLVKRLDEHSDPAKKAIAVCAAESTLNRVREMCGYQAVEVGNVDRAAA